MFGCLGWVLILATLVWYWTGTICAFIICTSYLWERQLISFRGGNGFKFQGLHFFPGTCTKPVSKLRVGTITIPVMKVLQSWHMFHRLGGSALSELDFWQKSFSTIYIFFFPERWRMYKLVKEGKMQKNTSNWEDPNFRTFLFSFFAALQDIIPTPGWRNEAIFWRFHAAIKRSELWMQLIGIHWRTLVFFVSEISVASL